MITTRMAVPADAPELVRLRRLMFLGMDGRDEPGPWERDAERMARRALHGGDGGAGRLGAFVVDGDEAGPPHLAACAVGSVEERLPAPKHPAGRFGFVFNVCTDERYRGRGYARATTEALLEWFAGHGVTRVDLHASGDAERLYRSMGFAEHSTALSLDLSGRGRATGV
ncbi:GNAT family N-acetyltransferase [Streptomyces marispadix]|uniref:GNAT family N-acetyltransferase n=1 Tax=Streptomyces marispadix TaxID=2922868 RepID=A0ABS9SRP9_9ACTN|nr:GNAT family N-acetyltransferase [Streptomyces marispadix]MCH6158960.1 GNAT family N-acetyltransferase [Streptomyces marispadix]